MYRLDSKTKKFQPFLSKFFDLLIQVPEMTLYTEKVCRRRAVGTQDFRLQMRVLIKNNRLFCNQQPYREDSSEQYMHK